MATKLTKAGRDKAQLLLEQHSSVTEALAKIGKRGFVCGLNVTNETGNDYTDVSLSNTVATFALKSIRREIESSLRGFGIEIAN